MLRRILLSWHLPLLLLLGAGCKKQEDCRAGTLFLELSLPSGVEIDRLAITVRSLPGGKPLSTGSLPLGAGVTFGTVEISFPTYPRNQQVTVTIFGTKGEALAASAERTLTLDADCRRLAVTLDSTTADAGADAPGGETLATPDAGPGGETPATPDAPAQIGSRLEAGTLPDATADSGLPADATAACRGACAPGASEACGRCGTRACQPDCSWGPCASEGLCQAGEQRACGNCGSERCAGNCQWSGTCDGQGVCKPAASEACGNCGSRTCGATCTWAACSGEGTCTAGSTRGCGKCGTERCGGGAGCGWTGVCESEGACSPGDTRACGNCGVERCGGNCQWSGTCENQGLCKPGASEACGNCGTRSCTASCTWAGCSGEGPCQAGATQRCGHCNLGSRTCSDACKWPTACTGDTGCTPGTTAEACGECGVNTCTSSCVFACSTPNCCPDPVSDHWQGPLGATMPWSQAFGDPATAPGDVLRLTFDDVVHRRALAGGFRISFTLTFTGDISFMVDAGLISQPPALKHGSGVTGLQLGGLKYGLGSTFGSFGAWNGQTVAGDSATVTVYVRATAKQVAVKVVAGGVTVKSGFVSVPAFDASVLQMIGANTNGLQGANAIDVGPITGCAGMSDDLVMNAYQR
jgi:hypothetical protein